MTIMKRRSLVTLAIAALVVVVAGCVPPGDPGTGQRNKFLEATAGGYAVGLGITVTSPDNGTEYACWNPGSGRNHWGWFNPNNDMLCYTRGLSTGDAHRGTVYMHEMGHAYAHRLIQVGTTWAQGPINNEEKFADCFAQLHGGNAAFNKHWGYKSCAQSWIDKIAQMEAFAPPNGAGWWPPG